MVSHNLIYSNIGGNFISVSPKISFKIHDNVDFSISTSIKTSENSISLNTTGGITYKVFGNSQFGIFFGALHQDSHLSTTLMILNLGVFGYNLKVPFFLGTSSEGPEGNFSNSGLAISALILAGANLVTYLSYRNFKGIFQNKKYSKLDVDFRNFQEKYNKLKDKERQFLHRILNPNELLNPEAPRSTLSIVI